MKLKCLFSFLPLFILIYSCKKEDSKPLLLSEVIVGKWERLEWAFYAQYGDTSYHPLEPPHIILDFKSDSIVDFFIGENLIESGSYSISDTDNEIITETSLWTMTISEFTKTEFVDCGLSQEGPIYSKYFKME